MRLRLIACAFVAALACHDVEAPRVPGASIQAPDSLFLMEGDTVRVTAILLDSTRSPTGIPIAWATEDTDVVTVSGDGLVHFREPGRTFLVALGAGVVKRVPVRTAVRFTDVFPGGAYNDIPWCALSTSGSLWCRESYTNLAPRLDSVLRLRTPGNRPAASLVLTSEHACGLLVDGSAGCWRLLSTPVLGDPSASATTPIDSPVTPLVQGPLVSLADSYGHACGVRASGDAWCWGYNYGRPDPYGDLHPGSVLGTGDTTRYLASTPVPVSGGVHFTAISAGVQHTCALDVSGNAWCWGSNMWGQLGAGALPPSGPANAAVPTRVPTSQTFTAISSGGYHTCALAQDGTVWCWGNVSIACKGGCSASPQQVSTSTFVSISAGGEIDQPLSCALTSDGTAYCWGGNYAGDVGDGTTVPRNVPTAVAIAQKLRVLRAGTYGACGITVAGDGYCWGGQVGLTPKRMPFQP